jgi:exopolyphosphatase/guanosine-5'-triphosphate,3'-diphosphate pyrophosphatase
MTAIIDIGANTIRLCVYDIGADGGIRQVFKIKHVVGLAGYIDDSDRLTREGVAETCASLLRFRETLAGLDIAQTHIFAAASLRNITNTAEVIETIRRETGYSVAVISGEEEGICGYTGATNRTPIAEGMLVDIGGGSTEIVLFKNGHPEQAVSVAIGSLSMFSKYVTRILPSRAQAENIRLEAVRKLKAVKSWPVRVVCGVGGIMRTLYKLNNAIFDEPPENRAVSAENAAEIQRLIVFGTRTIINRVLNICPERIHTITPGLAILNAIIKKYECETVIVSESGVREGYLIRNILRGPAGPDRHAGSGLPQILTPRLNIAPHRPATSRLSCS